MLGALCDMVIAVVLAVAAVVLWPLRMLFAPAPPWPPLGAEVETAVSRFR